MYEELIFPGVETIYDYISYYKNNTDTTVYSSKAAVQVWDETTKQLYTYYFSCGCTGTELKDRNGNIIITSHRLPFCKIDVKIQDEDQLIIENDFYGFNFKSDAANFLRFVKEYNDFIDKIIKVGIKECFLMSEKLYSTGMALPTKNLLNMIPQQFFMELNVYKAMLRNISWKDKIFDGFANFTMDEIRQAHNLVHSGTNEQAFQQIRRLFNNFTKVIAEKNSIPPALLQLTSFLLIRKAAIEVFAEQWKNNYDSASTYDNAEAYIAECVQKNILASTDFTAMTMLTYYLMSVDSTLQDDYYVAVQKVYSVVLKYENEKYQANFEAQLFQSPHNAETKRALNINDVDLMGGDEFETLVCKLFRKMGFQAYVTKHSGDQGIDVIAEKDTFKIGIQAKCYSSTVGNSAIQEAVAGKAYYGCNRVMVITNNTFTKSAEELASANNVILWGREILKEKLIEYPVF